jgi:hypothetical protein
MKVALTKEQRAAISRANGAKSRGPKTLEGKAISSQNALKHGLSSVKRARHIILEGLEKERDYQRFAAMMRDSYKPSNTAQDVIVDRITSLYWRMARASKEEALIIWEENDRRLTGEDPHYLIKNEKRMDAILRYEERLSREVRLCHSELEKLQGKSPTPLNNSSGICVTIDKPKQFND